MNRSALLLVSSLAVATSGACATLLGVEPLSGEGPDAAVDAPLDAAGVEASALPGCDPLHAAWVAAGPPGAPPPSGAVSNDLPDGSANTATDVCRVPTMDASIPGKLLPGFGCFYGDGDAEVSNATGYEILVVPANCRAAWAPSATGNDPPGAFPCGEDSQGYLFSCRVNQGTYTYELGHEGFGTNHLCVYSYASASLSTSSFDILTLQ
jgi:hypothetical protein